MSITKRNYLLQSLLLTLLLGGIGGVLYYTLNPHHYFGGYPVIPLFFWIGGVFTINMVEMCRRHSPKHLLMMYLLIRVLRMLLAVIVMSIYCVAVRQEVRAFVMTFIANYFIYLIHDSWFFFQFEWNRKRKKV